MQNEKSSEIEWFGDENSPQALIVRKEYLPNQTSFLTKSSLESQIGFILYPKNSSIPRHLHRPQKRTLNKTTECLLVRKGETEVTLYDQDKKELGSRTLFEGDFLVLFDAGHTFKQNKDTVLLEIKQGPYFGSEEKEIF